VRAPVAASVWQVPVAVGDALTEGQALAVLEAMKMETTVASPVAGRVHGVLVARVSDSRAACADPAHGPGG
jgi:biotin carboxyl carrier protein